MKRYCLFLAFFLFGSYVSAEDFPSVEVYEQTSKSVVLIHSKFDGKQSLVGAGSLIAERGTILTCAPHVVVDREGGRPAATIQVFVKPDRITGDYHRDTTKRYKADIEAYDASLDLAVLKLRDFHREIEPIPFARNEEVRIGEEVVAIGHPEQGGFWSVTYGHISGEIENQANVPGKDVYQTDTNINRGNSGGPLLDRRGYLVGVTANIARVGAGNIPITGVNFAIKSGVAGKWLERSGYLTSYGNPAGKIVTGSAFEKKSGVFAPSKRDAAPPAASTSKQEKENAGNAESVQSRPMEEAKGSVQARPSREQSGAPKEDKYLTPKRPYRMDEFLAEVEKDMSDIMEEMRGKIRR
jgi:serine protease Do